MCWCVTWWILNGLQGSRPCHSQDVNRRWYPVWVYASILLCSPVVGFQVAAIVVLLKFIEAVNRTFDVILVLYCTEYHHIYLQKWMLGAYFQFQTVPDNSSWIYSKAQVHQHRTFKLTFHWHCIEGVRG